MDFDDVLKEIGEFGLYQKLLLALVILPATIPSSLITYNQLFLVKVPDHWCKIPQLSDLNYTKEQILKVIPRIDNSHYSKCSRYAVDWNSLFNNASENSAIDKFVVNNSWPTEKCLDGWFYNTTQVESSMVYNYDLVCDKNIYPTIALTILNCGSLLGVYIFGVLNDRIGRKNSYFICLSCGIVGSILSVLINHFWLWTATRFIVGLTTPALYQIPFIIGLELLGPKHRTIISTLCSIYSASGFVILAAISYFVQDCVTLTLVTSLPFSIYYLYWFYLPESPRWLLANSRYEEALVILEKIAKFNKRQVPKQFKQDVNKNMLDNQDKDNVLNNNNRVGTLDLLRTPNMRVKTLIIAFIYFINASVYLGFSYYAPALGDNQYLSLGLSGFSEIPSYLLCWYIMHRFGRRLILSIGMIIGGISSVVTVLVPDDYVNVTLALYLFSKGAISVSFTILYTFAGELFPTAIRGIGIGLSTYLGNIGLVLIPFVTFLGTKSLALPLMIMGIFCVVGGITSFRLPETYNHALPQTLEEGEEFGKHMSFTNCFNCKKSEEILTESLNTVDPKELKNETNEELLQLK